MSAKSLIINLIEIAAVLGTGYAFLYLFESDGWIQLVLLLGLLVVAAIINRIFHLDI